jgi:hypothetical protein
VLIELEGPDGAASSYFVAFTAHGPDHWAATATASSAGQPLALPSPSRARDGWAPDSVFRRG